MLAHTPGSNKASVSSLLPNDDYYSDSDAERTLSRKKWCEAGVIKNPSLEAVPTRSVLNKGVKRKFNGTVDEAGNLLVPLECAALVERNLRCGDWIRVFAASNRRLNPNKPACKYIMEFIMTGAKDWKAYEPHIKMAGYEHSSLCTKDGWQAFDLPGVTGQLAWGKLVSNNEWLGQ